MKQQMRQIQERKEKPKKYPCAKCGKLRTKEEGGTVFTVCDKCWEDNSKEG